MKFIPLNCDILETKVFSTINQKVMFGSDLAQIPGIQSKAASTQDGWGGRLYQAIHQASKAILRLMK